jgi:predicted DsbA family dithiol-disulfide isomerase
MAVARLARCLLPVSERCAPFTPGDGGAGAQIQLTKQGKERNMSIEIKVWSDFVCPFCMIAEKPLLEAVRESGLPVNIEWMPFELRPYPAPTLRPEDTYLQTIWPQAVYPLASTFNVPIRLPSVSPQPHTHLAWEGYQFARREGKASAYNDRAC